MGTVWVMFVILNLFPMSKRAVTKARLKGKRQLWTKGQNRTEKEMTKGINVRQNYMGQST